MTAGSPEAVKRYVAAGVGWGFASKHSVATEITAQQLVVVPVEGWECRRTFYAIYRDGHRLTASQIAFSELAKSLMA
jgi:DNA-binding transcriptional LysR family regulator